MDLENILDEAREVACGPYSRDTDKEYEQAYAFNDYLSHDEVQSNGTTDFTG